MESLVLDLSPSSKLQFDETLRVIQKKEDKVELVFDFGFTKEAFDPFDPFHLQLLQKGVAEALNYCILPYIDWIASIFLYQGPFPTRSFFSENVPLKEYFLQETSRLSNMSDQLFERMVAMNLFADYLHHFVSELPEEIPLYASFFDPLEVLTKAEKQVLLSKVRFPHIEIYGQNPHASLGLCLPSDESLSSKYLQQIDLVLDKVSKQEIPYRIIPESLLNDEWYELDKLIVFEGALSRLGIRMLQGFQAAQGHILTIGNPLGFENESVFEDPRDFMLIENVFDSKS